MQGNDIIRTILKKSNTTQRELAEALGESKRTLDNKFYRDSFTATELTKIAQMFGYSLTITKDGEIIVTIPDVE